MIVRRLRSRDIDRAKRECGPSSDSPAAGALDGFARADVSEVEAIENQDAEVDASFKGTMRQLITFMMEDPRTISSSLEVLFIAKALERIGDHAKNISEYVVFLVQGLDVRYPKSVTAEGDKLA